MSDLQDFIVARVPAGWKTQPLWSLFRRRKEAGHPHEELLSVYRDYGVIPKSSRDDNHNKESEDLSAYQLVTAGSLVTNKMKAWQGSIAISRYRGIVSPAYYVYQPLSEHHDQFLHYLLRSNPYVALYGRISKGVRVNQWDLEHEALRNVPVILPDLETQKAIAKFLDCETVRIDHLIEKKVKLLERLNERWEALLASAVTGRLSNNEQLQETGSLYVPLLPSSWTLPRLKQLARVRGGITLGRSIPDGTPTEEVAYLRVANVQAGRLDLAEMTTILATESEVRRFSLKKYDILLNEGGDNDKLGRGAVWLGEIEPCLNQNHVFVAKPHSPDLASWISYCSNARYGRAFFQLNSKQSTNLASIAKSRAEQFPIPLPREKERAALLGLIDAAKEKSSTTRVPILASIERLREFRSALITAAVTGQIDVATWGKRGNADRQLDRIEKAIRA